MSVKQTKDEIRAYFTEHKNEMIEDLLSIARIPSVRGKAKEGMPFGEECFRALEASHRLFTEAGFEGECSEDGKYALAYYGGKDIARSVGVFAHTDVVPEGEGWTLCAPFSPTLYKDCVVGRGVSDNKSGVILALWFLKYCREKQISLARPITVFLGSAEETGMEDIRSFIQDHPYPHVSLVPDGGFPICYGEKGIARFYFDAVHAFSDVQDLCGGEAFNVVLSRARAEMMHSDTLWQEIHSALAESKRIRVCEADGKIMLEADGIPAHASAPQNSINAGYLLCDLLKDVESLSAGDRSILSHAAALLATTDGSVAGIAGSDGAFSPLTMTNGILRVENGKLSISFDVRYGTNISAEELEEKLRACAEQQGFSLRVHENKAGFLNPIDAPAVRCMLDAAKRFSALDAKPFLMGGGTYSRYLNNAYSIATYVPYVEDPFDGAPGEGEAHQVHEHLAIDRFVEAVALATDVILHLANE